jgi:protein O-mannosyl-transferase
MFGSAMRRPILLCVILLGAVLGAYTNHFDNEFHFDDVHTIVGNVYIRQLANIPKFFVDASLFSTEPALRTWRPVVSVSLAIDHFLGGGLKPFFFHLSTFLWFLLQLALMVFLYRRIMDAADPHPWNLWAAGFAAACYGLHPAGAETVNYIIQRGDLYTALGAVASLLWFVAYPGQRRRGWYLLPALAAYLSKSPALIYPAILLVYVFLFEADARPSGWSRAFRAAMPALCVTAGAALLTWWMTPATFRLGAASPALYRATQPMIAFEYFRTFFLATGLSADSDRSTVSGIFSAEALAGYLFVAALLAAIFYTSRKQEARPIAFGLTWFLLAMLPTSLTPLADVTNDHRMFFPFVGLALAAVWGLRLLVLRPQRAVNPLWVRVLTLGMVAVLALEAVGTRERNAVWRTDESLWRDVIAKSPRNARGWMNYGNILISRREYQKALPYLERAAQLSVNYPPIETNLAIAYGGLGRDTEARRHFERAIELAPAFWEPYFQYGRWLRDRGLPAASRTQLEAAVRVNPKAFPARELLTELYNQQGEAEKADRFLEETVKLAFDEQTAQRYMAALAEQRKKAGAAPAFPSDATPESLVNLAAQYCKSGNYPACLAASEKAVELRPKYAEAYNNKSVALLSMKRWDEGIAAARAALAIDPRHAGAKSNLEWALEQRRKAK